MPPRFVDGNVLRFRCYHASLWRVRDAQLFGAWLWKISMDLIENFSLVFDTPWENWVVGVTNYLLSGMILQVGILNFPQDPCIAYLPTFG